MKWFEITRLVIIGHVYIIDFTHLVRHEDYISSINLQYPACGMIQDPPPPQTQEVPKYITLWDIKVSYSHEGHQRSDE